MKSDTLTDACRAFREEVLKAGGEASAAAGHGRECAACREWSRLYGELARAGSRAQAVDLSERAIRDTRRRVADILAGAGARVKAPGWAWRWASAWSVAAAVVLFLGVAVMNRTYRDTELPGAPAVVSLAQGQAIVLDRQIDNLQHALHYRVARFEPAYAGTRQKGRVDDRFGEVRKRIEVNMAAIGRELASANILSERQDI
jgi:hypothetical protein